MLVLRGFRADLLVIADQLERLAHQLGVALGLGVQRVFVRGLNRAALGIGGDRDDLVCPPSATCSSLTMSVNGMRSVLGPVRYFVVITTECVSASTRIIWSVGRMATTRKTRAATKVIAATVPSRSNGPQFRFFAVKSWKHSLQRVAPAGTSAPQDGQFLNSAKGTPRRIA
jgi:hypothetical protein